MGKLLLTQQLAEQFAGGLLSIIRSDGEINPTESMALQNVLAEIFDGVQVDMADAMMTHVTSQKLAQAARQAAGGVYRGQSVSPVNEIGEAFVTAAIRIAESDAGLSARETSRINNYAAAFGVPTVEQR